MRILTQFGTPAPIVTGMDWRLFESQRDANAALKEKKGGLYVRKTLGQECVQGVCHANGAKVKRGMLSGAMLLAEVAQSAIIYQSLEDGQIWLCAVKEGIPIQEFDTIVDESRAREMLTEVMSFIPGGDIYGDTPGARNTLEQLFSGLTKKQLDDCRLKIKANPITNILLGVVTLAIMGGGAYVIMQIEKQNRLKKEGIELSLLQMQREREIAAAKERKLAEIQEQVNRLRETLWFASSPAEQLSIWLNVIPEISAQRNGWQPANITCTKDTCTTRWGRVDGKVLPSGAITLPGTLLADKTTEHEAHTVIDIQPVEVTRWDTGMGKWAARDLPVRLSMQGCTLSMPATDDFVQVMNENNVPIRLAAQGKWQANCKNTVLLRELMAKISLPGIEATEINLSSFRNGIPSSVEINGTYRSTNE